MAESADVPRTCAKCATVTLHRADEVGALHCMKCLARPSAVPPPIPTRIVVQKQGDGVVVGTIKLAGFIVALFFLLAIGTCVYVCGSVATTTSKSGDGPTEYDRMRARQAEADRARTQPDPAQPEHAVDEPVISAESRNTGGTQTAEEDLAVQRELVASNAVQRHCSKGNQKWKARSIAATFVPARFAKQTKHGLANVSVELEDKAIANGHTLWFQIGFAEDGSPTTITANKKISADICGMGAADKPFKLL